MEKKPKRDKSNPVAKHMEEFNRPKTILSKKDKQRQGHDKYLKQHLQDSADEYFSESSDHGHD